MTKRVAGASTARKGLMSSVMSQLERARHEHRKPRPAASRRASDTFIGAPKTMALSVCACGVVVRGVRGAFVKWRSAYYVVTAWLAQSETASPG